MIALHMLKRLHEPYRRKSEKLLMKHHESLYTQAYKALCSPCLSLQFKQGQPFAGPPIHEVTSFRDLWRR